MEKWSSSWMWHSAPKWVLDGGGSHGWGIVTLKKSHWTKDDAGEHSSGSIISICRWKLQPKVISVMPKQNGIFLCTVFWAFKEMKVATWQIQQTSIMMTLNWQEELVQFLSKIDKRCSISGKCQKAWKELFTSWNPWNCVSRQLRALRFSRLEFS